MLENQWSRPFLISLAQGSVDLRNQWLTACIGFHESELLGLVGHYWDSLGLTARNDRACARKLSPDGRRLFGGRDRCRLARDGGSYAAWRVAVVTSRGVIFSAQ